MTAIPQRSTVSATCVSTSRSAMRCSGEPSGKACTVLSGSDNQSVATDGGPHQPHLVAERDQLSRPMGGRARFHADQVASTGKELQNLATLQLPPNDNLIGCTDSMDLEYRLRDVEANEPTSSMGGSSLLRFLKIPQLGTSRCRRRNRPQHERPS